MEPVQIISAIAIGADLIEKLTNYISDMKEDGIKIYTAEELRNIAKSMKERKLPGEEGYVAIDVPSGSLADILGVLNDVSSIAENINKLKS